MAHKMGMSGKEMKINEAEKSVHKSGGEVRERPHSAGVGNERKAAVAAAQGGGPMDTNPLSGAVKELHKQHPIRHDDLGPHHGGRK